MKFYIKPKHFAHKRSFNVRDEGQNNLFKIKGKFFINLRLLTMKDMNGQLLYKVEKHFDLSMKKKYNVTNENGDVIASISRTYGLKPKFTLSVENSPMTIEGSLYKHAFSLNTEEGPQVTMQKQVFDFGEAFEIEVTSERKPLLHLFLMITIDQFLHERKKFQK